MSKTCPFCNATLNDGDVFCMSCGKRYEAPADLNQVQAASSPAQAMPQNSPWKLKLNYRNNLLLLDNNLALSKGKTRAAMVIRWRLLLDRCSQMVYWLKGQKEYVKAVSEAHDEFRKMRKPADGRSGRCRIDGLSGKIMFIEFLKRNI